MVGLLEVPFYVCEGRRCAQTALRSVLAYKGIRKSFEELDEMVGSDSTNSVSMVQLANALKEEGLEFNYFVRPNFFEGFYTNLKILDEKYPKRISRGFNVQALFDSYQRIREGSLFEVRDLKPSLEEFEKFIEEDKVPLCMIDYNISTGEESKRNGHYVVVTGIDRDYVYSHQSGPEDFMANKPFRRKNFLKGWDFSFIDWDLIVV